VNNSANVSFEESYYECRPTSPLAHDGKPYMRINTDVEMMSIPPGGAAAATNKSANTSANTSSGYFNSSSAATNSRSSGQIRPYASPHTDRKWPNLNPVDAGMGSGSDLAHSGLVPALFTPMPYRSQRDGGGGSNLRSHSDWSLSPKTTRQNRERFFDVDFNSFDNNTG
jgi:hypothetical protein